MANADALFHVDGLSKQFGGVQALANVTMSVAPGELRAVIGPNGAGKSTFFNTITGLFPPTSGNVFFQGERITGQPPHALARIGIGRTFQITSIFRELTVRENLQVALTGRERRSWSIWPKARTMNMPRVRELLALVGLTDTGTRIAGTLSHGDQKRLELAIALAGQPRLLLLDEPTAGMAAQERLASIHLVGSLARELGLTVIFTEHDMAVVFAVATVITVLHQGAVLAEGIPAAVRAMPAVQQVYLGEAVAPVE
ncbi:MAG: ABC transporter ATP-binding protein [Betaproteobacteria bacterium]|nr:ABC transporter ATP-binding protein [Betaproteobacteria bacterium]